MRTHNDGENPFANEFNSVVDALAGTFILEGCEPTQGTDPLEVDVSSGAGVIDHDDVTVGADTVSITGNPPWLRFDLLTVNDEGNVQVHEGSQEQRVPDRPTGEAVIGIVEVRSGENEIERVIDARTVKDYDAAPAIHRLPDGRVAITLPDEDMVLDGFGAALAIASQAVDSGLALMGPDGGSWTRFFSVWNHDQTAIFFNLTYSDVTGEASLVSWGDSDLLLGAGGEELVRLTSDETIELSNVPTEAAANDLQLNSDNELVIPSSSTRYKMNEEPVPLEEAIKALSLSVNRFQDEEGEWHVGLQAEDVARKLAGVVGWRPVRVQVMVDPETGERLTHGQVQRGEPARLDERMNPALEGVSEEYLDEHAVNGRVPDSVNYSKLVPYLLAICQHQEGKIEDLQDQVNDLVGSVMG